MLPPGLWVSEATSLDQMMPAFPWAERPQGEQGSFLMAEKLCYSHVDPGFWKNTIFLRTQKDEGFRQEDNVLFIHAL